MGSEMCIRDSPFLVDQCVGAFIHEKALDDEEFDKRKYNDKALFAPKVKKFKKAFPALGFSSQSIAFNGTASNCVIALGGFGGLHVIAGKIDQRLQTNGFERITGESGIKKGYLYDFNGRKVILLGKSFKSATVATVHFKLRDLSRTSN